jgi:hypothetical protein
MNLVLGILWLLAAVAVLVYELVTGERLYSLRLFGGISSGWLLLVLAAYNFARWYSTRMGQADQEALRIIHEARLRQARYHERPHEYDPNLDFTNRPPPRGPSEPPSAN